MRNLAKGYKQKRRDLTSLFSYKTHLRVYRDDVSVGKLIALVSMRTRVQIASSLSKNQAWQCMSLLSAMAKRQRDPMAFLAAKRLAYISELQVD